MTVGDDLERVAHERDEAREELAAMHRRAQRAESIIAQAGLVKGRPQGEHGRSLGRALANYAAETYRRERDEARAELAAAREALGAAWLSRGETLAEGIKAKTAMLERMGAQ